jgi:hypothetical protein
MIHIIHPLLDIAIEEGQLEIFSSHVLDVVLDQTLNENQLQHLSDVSFKNVYFISNFI